MNNNLITFLFIVPFILVPLYSCISGDKNQNEKEIIEWNNVKDPRTGFEVWQITSYDSISEALYFYAQAFTADDKYIIFRSKRTGKWDMYRCNLTDGKIKQLTNEGISAACIHPDGKHMVFISDWKYYKMNVHTMKKEMVMDFTGKQIKETWQ